MPRPHSWGRLSIYRKTCEQRSESGVATLLPPRSAFGDMFDRTGSLLQFHKPEADFDRFIKSPKSQFVHGTEALDEPD